MNVYWHLHTARNTKYRNRVPKAQDTRSFQGLDALRAGGRSNSRVQRNLRSGTPHRSNDALFERILKQDTPVTSRNDGHERAADRIARGHAEAEATPDRPQRLTSASGFAMPQWQKSELESRLHRRLDGIRVHDDAQSHVAAARLGAEAFTHGRDIFLGDRARVSDTDLMAHEAAHAVQDVDAIQRREATWLERRAWLGFFDHYLPRRFLNNYMDDTGNPITLTRQEMEDCNPIGVDITRSAEFGQTLTRLRTQGGGAEAITCTALAGAMTNGTLGNFTVRYTGVVTVDGSTGDWSFVGTIVFIDFWDFNTGGGNRPTIAEAKVVMANALLPGQPFAIDSVPVAASQNNSDADAQWTSATSQHVPDNLVRGALDIGGGGDVGLVIGSGWGDVGGVAGLGAGAEYGAQVNAGL